MKNYKVSVICALKDEILTLDECLNSLFNQTYKNKEIIIIDDESIDGSTEVAKEFAKKYPFVKYYAIKHEKDYILKARVEGVKKSKGEVLFVIDADAKYEPDYVKKCMKYIDKKGVGGILGKIRVWKKKNTFISKYRDAHYKIRWDDLKGIRKEISEGKIAPWIFKRKVYDEIGGYRKEAGWSADVDFGRRMLAKGYKIVLEPSVLWWHRWREGFFEVMGYSLFWSRLDFGKKKPKKEMVKMLYFLALPPLVILSLFFPLFWWLVLIHALPLFFRGIKLYRKAGKMYISGRGYLLLLFLVSYITNVPYAYGYFSNYVWK